MVNRCCQQALDRAIGCIERQREELRHVPDMHERSAMTLLLAVLQEEVEDIRDNLA